MKKNILYALVACLAFSFAACSDDPMDATEKHVYGPNENPYLKTNAAATISTSQEIPVQRIEEAQEIKLADYAEKFQTLLGMTVDEVVSGISNGSVVFCPINTNLGQWMRNTAPTKGTYGWHFNSAGGLCDASSAMYSVEFDASKKAILVTGNSNTAAGNYSFNVGFAIDNGTNFDDYVRFSGSIKVSDPSKVIVNGTFAEDDGSYTGFFIEFADYRNVFEVMTAMTLEEFAAAVDAGECSIYMVKADGSWDTEASYTAAGKGGYWFTMDGQYTNWGVSSVYFIEMYPEYVHIGQYPGELPKGTTLNIHFVITLDADHNKYVEFIVKGVA